MNFIGNVEGRDVFNGTVDVIVTDGFTGNVILKVSEALAEMVEQLLREEIKRTLQASVGFLLSRTAFRASSSASTTPSTAARRCWASRAASSSATAARAPRPIKNAIRFAAEFSRAAAGARRSSPPIADLHSREARAVQSVRQR